MTSPYRFRTFWWTNQETHTRCLEATLGPLIVRKMVSDIAILRAVNPRGVELAIEREAREELEAEYERRTNEAAAD